MENETPEYTHFLKITYKYEWVQRGAPPVRYDAYESQEEMELCRDNLRWNGNGAIAITRKEYDAAIAELHDKEAP